jgi:hypothetical protein
VTNEEKRAIDLRRAWLREQGLPETPWRLESESEQKKWLAKARATTPNGTLATTPRKRSSFTPASSSQRESISTRASIVSGRGPCDFAHATSRARGGCDDELCGIPLTRDEHELFDRGKLDVLPDMYAHGLWDELGHAITEHHVDLLSLLQRLTGVRFVPEITEVTDQMVERAVRAYVAAEGDTLAEPMRAAIAAALSVQSNERWTVDREQEEAA